MGQRIADKTRTSGEYSRADWIALRKMIIGDFDNHTLWDLAFQDYFVHRINSRFLNPIKIVEKHTPTQKRGEGFTITAVMCILIEYFQAYREGCIYTPGEPGLYEYKSSKKLFKDFLTTNDPFKFEFSDSKAARFYDDVRCGLLHEATTKGNATIMAKGGSSILTTSESEFIVHRDVLLKQLERYLEMYKGEFKSDNQLKINFFRKVDELNGIRRKLYLAYGSNLLKQQFEVERKVFVHTCCPARLNGFRLVFNKKSGKDATISFANLVRDKNETTLGVVYEIDEETFERLHCNYEKGYDPKVADILVGDVKTKAYTFISQNTCDARPTPAYVERILEGATEKGLPPEAGPGFSGSPRRVRWF
jgi:hypothetical protein